WFWCLHQERGELSHRSACSCHVWVRATPGQPVRLVGVETDVRVNPDVLSGPPTLRQTEWCGLIRLRGTITMNARQLINGAWYGPEALKAIGQAFDQAWHQIAPNFGDDPIDIQKARIRLARALLSVADDDSRDVGVLKQAGLHRMALDYKKRWDPSIRCVSAGSGDGSSPHFAIKQGNR